VSGTSGPHAARHGPVRVLREAAAAELDGWDARTVDVSGGDVQQSLAWGAHRERTGWEAHRLILDDGSVALVLGRRWRLLGGGRAYVPRGPVAAGAPPEVVAARLDGIAAWARAAGFDVLVADPEIPAASGFPAALARVGFRQTEEIGPSRHRVGVPIAAGATDASLLDQVTQKTRQQFLAAERRGVRVVRYDVRGGAAPGIEAAPGTGADGYEPRMDAPEPDMDAPGPGRLTDAAEDAFTRFHALLVATGERRGFRVGGRPVAMAWWRAALEAGHLLLLEARGTEDEVVAAAIFYRHGERLTYSHSGDVAALRSTYPGAMGLVLWRALQLAAREGRAELDLGGVDVRGARREPQPGEPTYGLLRFKQSFGGRWIELSGAYERVLRRPRHAMANSAQRASHAVRSLPRRVRRREGATS
jgi:lipid II:glycine glycyltransferase (peptidoglycan interpeptide bridge formation enzyme)